MTKLSLLLAPLSAAAALLVLFGSSGWLQGSPSAPPKQEAPVRQPLRTPQTPPTAAELDAVLESFRAERSLKSAADLLDAAIRIDSARRDGVRRLEAFGPANLPGAGDPEVGYLVDEDGQRLVLFDHGDFPEHAELGLALERAAADPWYEAGDGLLLRVEARVEAAAVRGCTN